MTPLPQSNISPRTSTWSTRPKRITTFQLLRMKSSSICCLAQFSQGLPGGYDSCGWGTCGSAMRTTWVGAGASGWASRRAESGKRHVEREWKNYRLLSVPNTPIRIAHVGHCPATFAWQTHAYMHCPTSLWHGRQLIDL